MHYLIKELTSFEKSNIQDYRNEGRIPYIQLDGKILYRESDIERMLSDSYRPAYRQTGT